MNVDIYGTSNCSYCDQAKQLCENNSLPYSFTNIEDDKEKMFELFDMIGPFKTVPQIFVDDEYVGGFKELKEKVNG